jgi:hypothetical protein
MSKVWGFPIFEVERKVHLLSLFLVEMPNRAMICKQVSATQKLCQEIYVSFVLQKSIVIQLNETLISMRDSMIDDIHANTLAWPGIDRDTYHKWMLYFF